MDIFVWDRIQHRGLLTSFGGAFIYSLRGRMEMDYLTGEKGARTAESAVFLFSVGGVPLQSAAFIRCLSRSPALPPPITNYECQAVSVFTTRRS